MDNSQRHRRLRGLICGINRVRKRQAKQIDILCNDMVEAHRAFIKRLDAVSFTADFYEALAGTYDLGGLLNTAGGIIKKEMPGCEVTFFLSGDDSFEMYTLESAGDKNGAGFLESCFNSEIVASVCEANGLCGLETLFEMGLQANPQVLSKIDALTIPLGENGVSAGFILVYRSSEQQLRVEEVMRIISITPGLTRAIRACRGAGQLTD